MDGLKRATPHQRGGAAATRIRGAGARVGLILSLVLGVGFAASSGSGACKQALVKKEAVAGEREQAQARILKKEPMKMTTRPPRGGCRGSIPTRTLKPWRDADVGFETPGRPRPPSASRSVTW